MSSTWLFVFTGGGIGSVIRFLIQQQLNPAKTNEFPLGTFIVNVLGCLLIGLLWGWSEKATQLNHELKFFLFTGICGGFTTFSAFSQESIFLLRSGENLTLLFYVVATVITSLLLTYLGYKLLC
jgi:CrcB protein